MGCFLACFGGPKERRRRRRSPKRTLPLAPSHELYKALRPNPSLAQLNCDSLKKLLSDKEIGASLPEIKESPEKGSPASYKKKVTFDLNVTTYEDPKHCDEEANEVIESEEKEQESADDRCSSKLSSFPDRYQDCEDSDEDGSQFEDDDAEEDDEYEDCDSDEERKDDGAGLIGANEEESYDSYFSLPTDKEQPSLQEVSSPNPNRTSSPDKQQQRPIVAAKSNGRDRSQYVHSVLNPVENLSQWKEVKVRAAPIKNPRKENINVEPVPGANKPQMSADAKQVTGVSAKQEISVDASLSNWLVSSENSTVEGPQESYSHRSNSPVSREERPILGALTVDDIKQSSVTSSPRRRSPSKSPDDMPILGTVGTHWNCRSHGADSASSNKSSNEAKGIPNATSKYREDRRVNWNPTPFEVRLERALNQGAA